MVSRGARVALLGAVVMGGAACRPSPECYSADECGADQMCVAGACTAFDGGVAGMLEPTWYEVIQPIVSQRCWNNGMCHVRPLPIGIPMALELYQDTQVPSRQGDLVYQRMSARVSDLVNPMPPRGQSQLSSQQIRFIQRWAQLGGPAGDPASVADGGVSAPDAGVNNTGPLAAAANFREVASGFFDLGGPAWGNASGTLVMTDRAQDTVFFLPAGGTPQVLLRPSQEAVGTGSDSQGNLLLTMYQSRQVVRIMGGRAVTVADRYQGSRFSSPHDVIGRADGNTYFTDPDFGLGARTREIAFNGIYRLPLDGSAVALQWQGQAGATGPAGMELSPDESTLFVADRVRAQIIRFSIGLDGTLGPETFFVSTYPNPDGLTVDSAGNVYVATAAGVQGFSSTGQPYGLIATPDVATGVVFGGVSLDTLFITTRTKLYRVEMPVAGVFR